MRSERDIVWVRTFASSLLSSIQCNDKLSTSVPKSSCLYQHVWLVLKLGRSVLFLIQNSFLVHSRLYTIRTVSLPFENIVRSYKLVVHASQADFLEERVGRRMETVGSSLGAICTAVTHANMRKHM